MAPEASGWEAFLRPSLYVQSDAPQVARLAEHLGADGADNGVLAERIRQWVHDRMVPRVTSVRFRSALEVLGDMEGSCSEYTVMVMALARACGLPARACSGLLIQDSGEMVPHVWAQVLADGWLHIDATLPQAGITAAHVQCGAGSLAPADLGLMNLPLQLLLANVDTVEVLSYTRRGQRFTSAAAGLFEAAESALRDGATARALELYHGVTRGEWTMFAGPAYLAIARHRLRAGEVEEAEWACRQILRLDPEGDSAPEALYVLSQAATAAGDDAEAIELLERLVAAWPNHALADDALARQAQILSETRGCAAAGPVYRRLQREYGESGWARVAERMLDACAE